MFLTTARLFTAACCALALCSFPVFAEFSLQQAKLQKDPMDEIHDAEVNVSGNIIVGIMGFSAHVGIKSNQPLLLGAKLTDDGTACLRVTSRDGAYRSANPYLIPRDSALPVIIPYPSKYKDVIDDFGQGDVGITATPGDCDQLSMHYLVPSSRSDLLKPDADEFRFLPENILVLVNGFDATDASFRVWSGSEFKQKGECSYIEEGRRTAFNFICKMKEIPSQIRTLNLLLKRELYGDALDEINVTISGGE